MLPDYKDITSRLGNPEWYDEHGVPRYDKFSPDAMDIYSDTGYLLEVACQSCGRKFMVGGCDSRMGRYMRYKNGDRKYPAPDNCGPVHYGDPPRHSSNDCCAGDTMNVECLRIVEWWEKHHNVGEDGFMEWRRKPEHEFSFTVEAE